MSPRKCPKCGGKDIRLSGRRGVGDRIIACLGLALYRCRVCRNRFYRLRLRNRRGVDPISDTIPPIDSAQAELTGSVDSQPVTIQGVFVQPAQPASRQPLAEHSLARIPVAYSLLIVSRDPAIRKLLCKLVTRPGYHTHQLGEAAQLASELRVRKVDLLIIDLDEPEQKGLERASTLRRRYPRLKIIALSGLPLTSVPGSIVLPKPFRRELLIEGVESLLSWVETPAIKKREA